MIRPRLLLLGTVFGALSGLGLYEAHIISGQRDRREALVYRVAELERERTTLDLLSNTTSRDLLLAEQQLAQLPPLPAATDVDRAHDIETSVWLIRVKQLRELSDAHPAGQIPEMRLLVDEDWLRVARTASFETDEQCRAALASVRTSAKRKFAVKFSEALTQFIKATNGNLPVSTLDLAPYLEPPADAAMLQRYAIGNNGIATSVRNGWIIREIAAVDIDYDSRHTLTSNGGLGSSSGPVAWIEDLSQRLQRARQAHAIANPGLTPTGITPLLPYFTPPLDPATLEQLLKAERVRKP